MPGFRRHAVYPLPPAPAGRPPSARPGLRGGTGLRRLPRADVGGRSGPPPRRRPDPEPEALLSQGSYPFVMQEFRFHRTLSGPFDGETLGRLEAVLSRDLARLLRAALALPVRGICLSAEREDGLSQVFKRRRFARGAAAF